MYRVIRYHNFGAVDLHLSTKDYYPRLDWLQMYTMKYYNSICDYKEINSTTVTDKILKITHVYNILYTCWTHEPTKNEHNNLTDVPE